MTPPSKTPTTPTPPNAPAPWHTGEDGAAIFDAGAHRILDLGRRRAHLAERIVRAVNALDAPASTVTTICAPPPGALSREMASIRHSIREHDDASAAWRLELSERLRVLWERVNAVQPPASPAPPGGLAEAARKLLDELGCAERCRIVGDEQVHHMAAEEDGHASGPAYVPDICPACALRRALAAEETQQRLRMEALEAAEQALRAAHLGKAPTDELVMRAHGLVTDALRAEMETGR